MFVNDDATRRGGRGRPFRQRQLQRDDGPSAKLSILQRQKDVLYVSMSLEFGPELREERVRVRQIVHPQFHDDNASALVVILSRFRRRRKGNPTWRMGGRGVVC
jgi:hypothetical protein